jgi:flagellar biosynthetic protein FliO
MGVDVFKTFAALAFVIGLIFVLAWAYRKYLPTGSPTGKEQAGWRMLGTRMLGPGKQIVVLEVGTKLLLVGMTKESMNSLMEVSDETDRKLVSEALSSKGGGSFADVLKRTRGQ